MVESSEKSKTYSRRSLRLKGYDYREPGMYFITICTYDMRMLFGKINEGEMHLNEHGFIARDELLNMQLTYPNVEIFDDEYVIMPNHIHVILWITDVGATHRVAKEHSSGPVPQSLSAIIGQYKSRVTKEINLISRRPGEPIWQRSFYDRIIRNNEELLAIKKYIIENPLRWEEDRGDHTLSFI